MKRKLRFGIVLTLITVIGAMASAAPIGRPITAEHQWVAGVIGDVDHIDVKNDQGQGVGEMKSSLILGEAAYGFSQDAEFYLRLGGTADEFVQGPTLDLGSGMAWGVGLRSVLYESWRDWRFVGDLQYLSRPDHGYGMADLEIWEGQMAVGIETRFNEWYPYGGAFYNHLEVNSNNQAVYLNQKNAHHYGVYLGLGWEPRPEWALFAETRLVTGFSLSGGAAYRF